MKKRHAVVLVGTLLGLFLGSSIGIAAGGTAINGAWVCAFLGAFIGWLIGRDFEEDSRSLQGSTEDQHLDEYSSSSSEPPSKPQGTSPFKAVLFGGVALIASFWNFHIDLLSAINLLNNFCNQPWLFVGLGILVSLVFPPFGACYFISYVCAAQFGASKENQYRAQLS